ncbi:MAG: DUF1698 domain-containing protein, partial [Acidimicrobiia bacterium]|nr:DUF1698 domain-containing protein [Acidimicrobiia bacterium]
WDPVRLPGRTRFDLARWALGSRVEPVVADIITVDPRTLGSFDVTLFCGVLYHLADPITGLRQLARLTTDLAVIETELIHVRGGQRRALWHYVESDSLANDPSNYWLPTRAGLAAALRDAGFASVEFLAPAADPSAPTGLGATTRTALRRAKRAVRSLRPPYPDNFRQVIHARKG